MTIFLKVIFYFCFALIVLAAGFQALDVLWDRQDKDRLKQRILDFWIATSEIEFIEQLHRALDARYARMRSLRKQFVELFWILCVVVAVSTIYDTWADKAILQTEYKTIVKIDFASRYEIHCLYLMWGKSAEAIKAACDLHNRSNSPPELAYVQEREKQFNDLVSTVGTEFLLFSDIASTVIGLIVVSLPLTAALLISLNVTLWILSRITRSGLRLTFLVLFDFLVALFMPPLLTSICMLILVGAGVFIFGQVIDLGWFVTTNWLTLTLGTVALEIMANFIFPALLFSLATVISGTSAVIVSILTVTIGAIWLATYRVFEFIVAVGKFVRLDFSNDYIQSTVDWAIFTDLLFSTLYLVPCLLLVLANRSGTTRRMFLNLVMWVGDHSRGPFIALAEIASSVFALVGKLFISKA
jgi:hypothetical protein